MEKALQQINQIIQSGKYLENKDKVLNFLKNKELKYYFLNKIPKKFDDLPKIGFLLEELLKDERPFELFKILEESINKKNNIFIVKFLKKHYGEMKEKLREELFKEKSLVFAQKILKEYPNTVNDIYNLVKRVLTLKGNEYKKLETSRDYSREKELISKLLEKTFSVFREQGQHEKIEEIIKLADKHFNLIGDDGEYSMYTPESIFRILKDYIDIDFEKNFKKITKILINQYSQEWKNKKGKGIYKGWELMGGVTSLSESDYRVPDRHFIRFTLQPALKDYYEKEEDKEKTWKFILENCVTKSEKVNKNRPDFLNRAVIPIIIDRYKNGDEKVSQEAFEILKEFILSPKGIPYKSDLIYQEIRRNFLHDKKWQLVKVTISKYKLPINPFVEQIALELAEEGNEEAKNVIKGWIKNPDYYKRGKIFESNIVGTISRFLEFSFDEGVEMFKDFISQEYFIKSFDTFFTFHVAGVLNKIINKNFEVGLKILNQLAQKPKLSENEQILLCSSLSQKTDITQENEKILMRIYKEFLDPFLKDLNNNIRKIEAKITRSQSREAIVEFASLLAKCKKIPEAMRIIGIFVKDSDPCTPEKVDPKDPEGKYDEHKRIEQGEDTHAITTVRGWCAWVLMESAILEGRNYIEEIIGLTEKLTKDKNYYVQWMSCHPLSQLARNRLAVMPENRGELFFNKDKEKALKMAKRVENIAFNFLDRIWELDPKPKDVLMKALLRVFDHMRGLNQKDASKFVKAVANCGEEVIAEAASLFIYFAEFRTKGFKDWKWQMPGLYDDLKDFDDKEFKQILKKVMLKSPKTRSAFAWHFWKLVKDSVPDKADIKNVIKYSEAFEVSNRYLNVLVERYDHQTFTNIYYFIQENINERFKECYKLWKKCLEKEREYIKKECIKRKLTRENIYEISWWPFYYNGEILKATANRKEYQKFLSSFEFLLGYPKEINIGDINEAVGFLQGLPIKYNQQIEKIFNKLIERDPNFYSAKEAWKKTK